MCIGIICAFAALAAQLTAQPAIVVDAERLSDQPVIKSGAAPWMASGVFNPAAVMVNGKTVLLFRATGEGGTSRIGYAESTDGLHFKIDPEPVLVPAAPYEEGGGVEDPRVVRIGDTYYMTYTGYNRHDAQLCLATSTDLRHWERHGVILPAYKGTWNNGWTKSGAIVPERINGRWWMYYLGTRHDSDGPDRDYMGLASSDDLLHWADSTSVPVLDRRPGAFDSRVMEPGPPPLMTDAGILLLYNGASDKLVYGPGWILFDKTDPRRVLARSDTPFLLPSLEWERVGTVPNVIFLEGVAARAGDPLDLTGYYGGTDRYVGAMRIRIGGMAAQIQTGVTGGIFRIQPVRPVAELRAEALAAKPPVEAGSFRKSDLVDVATLDRRIKLDIRYATANNFLSTPVYSSARAFLQRPAAEALLRAQRALLKRGYGLLIFDAYRPWYVTKIFWDATPPDKHEFVADPAQGSRHNRGCAVDLSIYDLKTGREVEMTGVYDEMSERSYPSYAGGSAAQRSLRDLLRQEMEKQGFTVFPSEWWHFDYRDWKEYGIQNLPFEEISGRR
jgi:D-alanyl-D-alanine dipeptidase